MSVGNLNQFTIAPKTINGNVLQETVTAAGFTGQDLFLTETYLNGAWYRDQGIAIYNPVMYEIMSVFVPSNVTSTVYAHHPDFTNLVM